MNETSKTLKRLAANELACLTGRGLDIGCGSDPVRPDVERFDVEHGDANRIGDFIAERACYDYVFSSHCLEHMHDARVALHGWWSLVRPGGVMMVIVPDEDLYEQRYWPSLFNPDHKATFRHEARPSWSPVSRDLTELAQSLGDTSAVTVRRQDEGYDHSLRTRFRWPWLLARFAIRVRNATVHRVPAARSLFDRAYHLFRFPIDQTERSATAQIIAIIVKRDRPGV